jgi:hypothetical protein
MTDHRIIRHGPWLFLGNPRDAHETCLIRTCGDAQPKSPGGVGRELVRALSSMTPEARRWLQRGDRIWLGENLAAVCPAPGVVAGPD